MDKTELQAILDASSTKELSDPIEKMIDTLSKDLPLDKLSEIAMFARKRVETIDKLDDLAGNYGQGEQFPGVKITNWFGRVAQRFASYGLPTTATDLLTELWNRFGEYQHTLSQRDNKPAHFYRAGIGMYLGRLYSLYEQRGEAIWWLLHAHADDLLTHRANLSVANRAAHDMLRLSFGISSDVFEHMQNCVSKRLDHEKEYELYAEHIVMQLSLQSEFAHLFSYPTSIREFPIGRAYSQCMRSRLDEGDSKGHLQGAPLEEFARYLVLLMAGWVPTKNMYHWRTDIDSDVVARYIREPQAISSAHPRAILIECKNIRRTLNVAETGYFLYRMHLTQVGVGVLFARKNVTGEGDEVAQHQYAQHLLDLAFQQNGTAVVVIDLDDLDKVAKGDKTLWTLIDSGIVKARFGVPRQTQI